MEDYFKARSAALLVFWRRPLLKRTPSPSLTRSALWIIAIITLHKSPTPRMIDDFPLRASHSVVDLFKKFRYLVLKF